MPQSQDNAREHEFQKLFYRGKRSPDMKPASAALMINGLAITLIAIGNHAKAMQIQCDDQKCSADPNTTTMSPAPTHPNNVQEQEENCEVRTTLLDGNIRVCL